MKVVGIIAEFNPFHDGHKYIIKKAKEIVNADFAVILMSPDFVQRGEPAIFNKYNRSKYALENNADLIIELPIEYSTSNASMFAYGAVLMFSQLGIKEIVFGCEISNINVLSKIAEIELEEPYEYKNELKKGLKSGLSFPKSRSNALIKYNPCFEEILLSPNPNTTLGVQYLKANKILNANMNFHIVKRIGANYNDLNSNCEIPSASALRKNIVENKKEQFLLLNDFTLILKSKLINMSSQDIMTYYDIDNDLANLVYKNKLNFQTITDLIFKIKNKNYTYSKISRALLHILLDIKSSDIDNLKNNDFNNYIKVLGVKKSASDLLSYYSNQINNLIINKKDIFKLNENALYSYNKNLEASMLYEMIFANKYNVDFIHEDSRKFLVEE